MARLKWTPLIAALITVLAAGCVIVPADMGVTVYCDHVEVDSSVSAPFESGMLYIFIVARAELADELEATAAAITIPPKILELFEEYEELIEAEGVDVVEIGLLGNNLQIEEPLARTYPEGKEFVWLFAAFDLENETPVPVILTNIAPCQEEEVEHDEPEVTWFEPGDGRINRQAYASAAVYCDLDNRRVNLYGVDTNGEGVEIFSVPFVDLPGVPSEGNTWIAGGGGVNFYRLTSGEYQVMTPPDAEGKQYVVIFDDCPHTYLNAYILQNGVLTQTEAS